MHRKIQKKTHLNSDYGEIEWFLPIVLWMFYNMLSLHLLDQYSFSELAERDFRRHLQI